MKLVIIFIQVFLWISFRILSVSSLGSSNYTDHIVRVARCQWFPRVKRCENYGMEFLTTSRCSFLRHSIYCRKRIHHNNQIDMNPNTLRIASYNVNELPYLFTRNGQRERTCRIPEELLSRIPKVDVIVFQELFLGGCLKGRMSVIKILRAFKFKWFYGPTNNIGSLFSKIGSGLLIASRWPIVRSDFQVFQSSNKFSADNLARKGSLYAAIKKGKSRFHIFATHLQSGHGTKATRVRKQQAREIYQFKTALRIPKDEVVIFAGDFNEDMHSQRNETFDIFQSRLKANLAKIVGRLIFTYDKRNPLTPSDTPDEWLDYVAYSGENKKPASATMEAIDLRSRKYFEYCSLSPTAFVYQPPSSFKCWKKRLTSTLSDHYLVNGVIQL